MDPQQPVNQNNPNPQPQQPQVFGPSSLQNMPYSANAQPAPIKSQGSINDPQLGPKSKKGLLIAVVGGAVLLTIIVIIVILAGGQSKKPSSTQKKAATDNSSLAPAIQPAQSVDLEQANNALSQDLSRLDDEKDLPNSSLDDNTLGL